MQNQIFNRIYNSIIFLLLAFLPISNVIVYYSTNILKISPYITLWKEVLMVVLIAMLIVKVEFKKLQNQILILVSLVLIGLGLYSTWVNKIPFNQLVIGFRFELLWVILLALVLMSKAPRIKFYNAGILTGFTFVVLLSLIGFIIGEQQLYSALGFQNGWGISGQVFNTPFCHTTNGGLTDCRLTAGFSSANNLAGYLLMVLFYFVHQFKVVNINKYFYLVLSLIAITLLFFTYSRFVIIALVLSIIILAIYYIQVIPKKFKKILIGLVVILPFFSVIVLQSVYENKSITSRLPSFIVKEGSSADHFKLTSIATDVIKRDGVKLIFSGYGLSQTGPGAKSEYIDFNLSNFVNKNKDIAARIGIPDYNMSVPENWFLQVILNGGYLYAAIYFVIIAMSLRGLLGSNYNYQILLLGLFSIVIANLYLHIWESVSISIYYCLILLYYRTEVDKLTNLEQIQKYG
jgi:O-Antigen ligase